MWLRHFVNVILQFLRRIFGLDPCYRIKKQVLRDLAFARGLLGQMSLEEGQHESIKRQLDRLEVRTRSGVLHLAVVGEFNSGKSTFINALLRQRLLKSANIATTATATEIHHGSILQLRVQFKDGSASVATEAEFSDLRARLNGFVRSDTCDLQKLIDLVAADPDASLDVDSIELLVPSSNLRRGMSILDTPGIGAGPEYARHHEAVTERVVSEQADIAVVLIPADAPVSETLLRFLSTTLRPFLNRCLFVITKLDHVDEADRVDVRRFVEQKLSTLCGRCPVVLEAAAISMVPLPNVPKHLESRWTYWRAEFVKLEALLLERMSRQRSVIVSENLVRLLQEVILGLNEEIARKLGDLDAAQRSLDVNSVPELERVLVGLSQECRAAVEAQIRSIRVTLQRESHGFEARSKASTEELLECSSWKDLTHALQHEIPSAISAEEELFNKAVWTSFVGLDGCCLELNQRFAATFESHYRSLRSMGLSQLPGAIATMSKTSVITRDFIQTTQPIRDLGFGSRVKFFFQPDKKKQELRSSLYIAIQSHVQHCVAQWGAKIAKAGELANTHLTHAVHTHLQQYSLVVTQMIQQHRQRCAAVERERQAMQQSAAALAQRSDRLNELKVALVASAAETAHPA